MFSLQGGMMKVLVLHCHPDRAKSRINRALCAAAREVKGVTVHELYDAYPHGFIDVKREQALLQTHDIVVMQFPMFWYSTPPLLKAWQDDVLTHGFAYGSQATLGAKQFVAAVSVGAHPGEYGRSNEPGKDQFDLHELLAPLEAMARYCGWHHRGLFLTGYNGEPTEDALTNDSARYAQLLARCVAGDLPALFSTLGRADAA
jgi:glutathione-regulated potassium-efflux system ancillary protein KefG